MTDEQKELLKKAKEKIEYAYSLQFSGGFGNDVFQHHLGVFLLELIEETTNSKGELFKHKKEALERANESLLER